MQRARKPRTQGLKGSCSCGISHFCMEGKGQPAEKEHVALRQVEGASRAGGEGMILVFLPGGRVCIIMPLKITEK